MEMAHAIMSTVMSYLPATLSSLHTVTSGSAMIMNDWNHDVTQRSNEVKSVLSGLIDQIDSGSFQPKAVADDDPMSLVMGSLVMVLCK